MPPVPIIDSHVHLWDPSGFRMPWLDGNSLLDRPFGLADFREHSEGIAVEGIVYLEVDIAPSYRLLEARWVAELEPSGPPILGIVASAPLEDGDRARSFLEALVAIDPRVRGVRRLYQGEADPRFCLQPAFIRGVQLLAEYGLSFDLGVRHHNLAGTIELVRACPEVRFILDHIGKPDIRAGRRDPWQQEIRDLAALPNVVCKVSGMVTEADLERWTAADLAPYIQHVLETFGEDRVLFGGDWPVVLMASSYRRWVETLEGLTSGLSAEAQRKLWRENARRAYRLEADSSSRAG